MRIDRVEIPQEPLPGTDGAESTLILHAVTPRNFTARVTVARRAVEQTNRRYHDIVLTLRQLDRVIAELQRRRDMLADGPPGTMGT